MIRRIMPLLLSICMLSTSVCYAQQNNSHRYEEGIYTIGTDIPMGKYVFLTNDPDEIGYYVIYGGSDGAFYNEKYILKDEYKYRYPDLMKKFDKFRTKIVDAPQDVYEMIYDDYFEYSTAVDFNSYKSPEKTVENIIFSTNKDKYKTTGIRGCYIKLVNCYAVPDAEVGKLDFSRNGSFKAGRDFEAGAYTIEYLKSDASDIKYTAMNNIFSKTVGRTANYLYVRPETDDKSLFTKDNDYVEKRDVTLKNSKGESIVHKPRDIVKSELDDKYDFTQVRDSLKKTIGDEINKNIGNRYCYKIKAKSSLDEDIITAKNWLFLAQNDAEKQYIYMISEMYYLINEYLRGTAFSVDRSQMDNIMNGNINEKILPQVAKLSGELDDNVAPDTYRQLFKCFGNAKNFSEIKYICDKMIADMY